MIEYDNMVQSALEQLSKAAYWLAVIRDENPTKGNVEFVNSIVHEITDIQDDIKDFFE